MSLHLTEEEYNALQAKRRNERATAKPRAEGSFASMRNNADGQRLEGRIQAACGYYRDQGRAYVEKIPEPFRTTHTYRDGTFTGRFIANAQPDFMGILADGRGICFEAKHTGADRINQSVVTKTQWETLENFFRAGASSGVCVGFPDMEAFIPWPVWRNMKELYGRKYMTREEAEQYRIQYYNGYALFLDYEHKNEQKELEGR